MAGLRERLKRQRARKRDANRKRNKFRDLIRTQVAFLRQRPRLAAFLARKFNLRFTGGHRTKERNDQVGGVPNSWHLRGTPAEPGAIDTVGSMEDMEAALAWARANVPDLAEGLIHDVTTGLHLHLGGVGVMTWRHPHGGRVKRWKTAAFRQRKRSRDAQKRIDTLKDSIAQAKRDARLAAKARAAGARHALDIIETARATGVPLHWAFALVEQETGEVGSPHSFRNIFGGDHGVLNPPDRAPFFRVPVTKERVAALLRWVNSGKASNGVGLTQLTDVDLIRRADALGGAEKIIPQLRVGFAHLKVRAAGDYGRNSWRYNGRPSYQSEISPKAAKWKRVLS